MIHDRDAVVLAGVRTAFVRAWTLLGHVSAVELGRFVVREAVERAEIDPEAIDEVVLGSVAVPAEAVNPARVVALEAKIPRKVPAVTVGRNCASGLEAVAQAASRIRSGESDLAVVAAVESMSGAPFLLSPEAHRVWTRLSRARGPVARAAAALKLRPRHVRPVSALELAFTDPTSGTTMGESAERLAREFDVSREAQDAFALGSHSRAAAAWTEGRFSREVVAYPIPPAYEKVAERDNGVRPDATLESLGRLRPAFDRREGTVTAGNASQISDGAVALVLASGARARATGARVLGRIVSWAFSGCDPARMGLGPVFATPAALKRAGIVSLDRLDRLEINEAFAAQVLACLRAFESRKFFEEQLGCAPIGSPDPARLNVDGGAIALGHPVGATGARLVLTLLRQLQEISGTLGLATLCVGGGQGAAMVVERV